MIVLFILRSHFSQIIQNQTGIIGDIFGNNNYRDTLRENGLGLSILQHRAPMLKLSIINTSDINNVTSVNGNCDPMLSMQYAQSSYQRFYNKFLQSLNTAVKNQGIENASSTIGFDQNTINQLILTALKQVNLGKTTNSPWANSGTSDLTGAYCSMQLSNPSYVPASSARLGITSTYQPMVYIDNSYSVPQLVLQTHDGSRLVLVDNSGLQLGNILHNQTSTTNSSQLSNPIAAAWLQFELNLFNNIPSSYKDIDTLLAFDVRTYMPGKWRTSDYTRSEIIQLQIAAFDKWTISTGIDWRSNTSYQTDNQFSYNYSNVFDNQGQSVPGHWQGIYRWFYDTDRPHTHPWEMLGFSQKPLWWDTVYGTAPYTSGNTALWSDLSNGIIVQGNRQGTYTEWARPGLLSCIPVDSQGNLLPPFAAGCVASLPDVYSSSSDWKFGDGSPIESAWIYSQDYSFVLSQTGYLMKPARFIEYTWDILRTTNLFSNTQYSQWVYIDTNSRRSSNQFYVHREQPNTLNLGLSIPNESNLSYFGSCGFQHWLSEYIISQSLNVTNYFGNIIRGADVQLAHRLAGYINTSSLKILVDSFGQLGYNSQIIPSENINTYLYHSNCTNETFYGGIIIEQVSNGWLLYGYDVINQYFTIIPSNVNGGKNNVVIGNQKVIEYTTGLNTTTITNYKTLFSNRQAVYDFIISYGRWLVSQGFDFESYDSNSNIMQNWSNSAKEFLLWSQGSWANGTFITLSPAADSVTFSQTYGNIQYVNGIVSGTYPVIDRAGAQIRPNNIVVIRNNNSITVKSNNTQGIYGLRLYTSTLEHAVFLDNLTNFGDVIYQPIYNSSQQRVKIYCYRTNNWTGTLNAPGYIITQNSTSNTWSITSNFEKTSNDITKYFNIEQPSTFSNIDPATGTINNFKTSLGTVDNPAISNLARHMIGYQSRDYLQNLLLEDSTEFEFYQGFIKQKGTAASIN